MHVAYLLRDYPSLSQTFVRNEIFALRQRGHRVTVIALRDAPQSHIPAGWSGPRLVAARNGTAAATAQSLKVMVRHPRGFVRMWRQVRRLQSRERWTAFRVLPGLVGKADLKDVAVCHTHFAFDNAFPTLYLSRLLDVPATITVHAADIYREPDAAVGLLQNFDAIFTVCEFNREFLRRQGLTQPLDVVPCGVDVPALEFIDDDAEAGVMTVLSVGRFVPKKGFEDLVSAWALMAPTKARLQLVGDGPLREKVESLARTLGVSDTVDFLGACSNAEVHRLMTKATVFALACAVPPDQDTDALPVVLREALSRAVPVVTTRVAGVPEAVGPNGGWVVEPSSPRHLARALEEALGNREERRRRGVAGRDHVRDTATLEIGADILERALIDAVRSTEVRVR